VTLIEQVNVRTIINPNKISEILSTGLSTRLDLVSAASGSSGSKVLSCVGSTAMPMFITQSRFLIYARIHVKQSLQCLCLRKWPHAMLREKAIFVFVHRGTANLDSGADKSAPVFSEQHKFLCSARYEESIRQQFRRMEDLRDAT